MLGRIRGVAVVAACVSVGCYAGLKTELDGQADSGTAATDGTASEGSGDESGEPVDDPPVDDQTLSMIGVSGLRRLTAAEYDATVRDLLDVEVDAQLLLPEDWRQPFDNDYTTQVASQALVEGAELLGADVAAAALETPARRDTVVGCTPASDTDEDCFRQFVTRFGRRALRRPLTDTEIERFTGLIAESEESGDFYAGIDVALRAFLQHPSFLYRVEIGTPVEEDPDVFRLDDYEVATRLSYFIWGSTPDDELLDVAEAEGLGNAEEVAEAAKRMIADDKARDRVARFHALWLGYEQLPHAASLNNAMQAETQALIERVIFDERTAWQDLLRSTDTFIDDVLAEHYGLPPPGRADWVGYGNGGRQGLLSHGSFLSAMAKVNDSSPTKRGILIRTRMMCEEIPPPPPGVDVDNVEPPEGVCKDEFYRSVHAQGNCAACHALMDPIGLGLENYDNSGAFRTVENDDPTCEISGDGELDGQPFNGPAELSDLLLASGTLNACVATQLYRFAMGRSEVDDLDEAFIDFIAEEVGAEGDFDFAQMVERFAGNEAFRFRREEAQ